MKKATDETDKSYAELQTEIAELRARISALEKMDDKRRQAEKALRESEEQLLTLINAMPDIICFKDGNGRWLQANEFDLRLFEIENVPYKGKKDSELAHYSRFYRDAFLACEDSDETAWEARKTVRSDEIIQRSDGSTSIFDIIKIPLFNPDGSRKGLVVIGRDITERKKAEEELLKARDELEIRVWNRTAELEQANASLTLEIEERKKAEAALRFTQFAIDKARDQAFWMTEDGHMVYVNEAACRALGYTRDELLQLTIPDIDPMVDKDTFARLWQNLRNSGSDMFETLHKAKDGHVYPVEIRANLVVFDGREYDCAFATDITERKRTEDKLMNAKEQAELYLDLMGHDINNLNQAAMGFLELALTELEAEHRIGLDEKILIEKPLKTLKNSSALISNVRKIQQLMTEGIKTVPIDLCELFGKLDVHSLIPEDRSVTINVEQIPHCVVKANDLLRDVFTNLITNAIKHSDPEKPLTINIRLEEISEKGQTDFRCVVEDDGPGIPDELKGRLFHRFQRGATRAHGKGLGLFLVRMLVESYGGKVLVEDRVPGDYSKGARFIVVLPAA